MVQVYRGTGYVESEFAECVLDLGHCYTKEIPKLLHFHNRESTLQTAASSSPVPILRDVWLQNVSNDDRCLPFAQLASK